VSEAFRYLAPASLDEALDALREAGSSGQVLAGGTDLLVAARRGAIEPRVLVDVTRIPDLHALDQEEDGTLRVGAALPHARVAEDPLVRKTAPLLAQACASVGSVQVRNLGTLGGNAANAAVAADTLPALAALRAHFEVAGAGGARRVSVDEFFLEPGKTVLGEAEILTAVLIPLHPLHGAAFLKVGRRRAAAISRLSVAALVNPDTGMARLSLGAVFPRPRRVEPAEEVLRSGFGEARLEEAAGAAHECVREVSGERPSMRYKLPVVRASVVKTLRRALAAWEETR
jgi:CO/xanthine dehydrogenase FAD-binding subunit